MISSNVNWWNQRLFGKSDSQNRSSFPQSWFFIIRNPIMNEREKSKLFSWCWSNNEKKKKFVSKRIGREKVSLFLSDFLFPNEKSKRTHVLRWKFSFSLCGKKEDRPKSNDATPHLTMRIDAFSSVVKSTRVHSGRISKTCFFTQQRFAMTWYLFSLGAQCLALFKQRTVVIHTVIADTLIGLSSFIWYAEISVCLSPKRFFLFFPKSFVDKEENKKKRFSSTWFNDRR